MEICRIYFAHNMTKTQKIIAEYILDNVSMPVL